MINQKRGVQSRIIINTGKKTARFRISFFFTDSGGDNGVLVMMVVFVVVVVVVVICGLFVFSAKILDQKISSKLVE